MRYLFLLVVLTGCMGTAVTKATGPSNPGDEPPATPNLIPQAELFMCIGQPSDAPTRIRRVNRWEWTRNVGGAVSRSWTGFSFFDNPFDPAAHEPFSTYASDETVDDSMVEIVLPILAEYGESWSGAWRGGTLQLLIQDSSLSCMWDDAQPSPNCVENYVTKLLERGVLYRPPSVPESSRLIAFAQQVLAQEVPDGTQAPRDDTLSQIVNAAMLTSGALFRTELGTPTAEGRSQLTEWELAQQLSYALGSRAPGAVPAYRYPNYSAPAQGHYADIAGAARDGSIRSAQTVDSLIRQHVGGMDAARMDLVTDVDDQRRSRRGEHYLEDGVANFFRDWLGYMRIAEIFKDRPEATSAFDDGSTSGYRPQLNAWTNLMSGGYGYESLLTQQMDDFIARAVAPDTQVFKTLLTSRQFFLAASMEYAEVPGQPYNFGGAIAETNTERWKTLPANERAGVLTHPAWLAAHGNNFEDDPSAVHRGKWVREKLLCGYVPPLSEVRVKAQVGPHSPNKSARVRLSEATASAECQGCHSLMNPLGFPFEIYNHAGYWRVKDRSASGGYTTPDGSSTLIGMPDPALDGPVRDAVELSERFADSPYVKRCFLRQVFRYFMGRNENRADACTLSKMEAAYDGNNGSLKATLSALMTSDTWTTRRLPKEGE
jgi:hypothetical protein